MNSNMPFGFGMTAIPTMINGRSRSISAENPNGEKGAGGKSASDLGTGRKGRACIMLQPGETVTLAEISGCGVLQHFWLTFPNRTKAGYYTYRDLILRIYWDGEPEPSVETPIGDFFCNGFAEVCTVNSLPIVVNPVGGMNCYFPMPFKKSARVTLESQHAAEMMFFYQFNYMLLDGIPDDSVYFHAQWRRSLSPTKGVDHILLDGVRGSGYYVGTYLAWAALGRYWWGEGEMKFYIDGDEWPTICGTGTEDYFGGAWGFAEMYGNERVEQPYTTPFMGYPYYSTLDESMPGTKSRDTIPMHGLYRWHLPDPIVFTDSLKVSVQQIGNDGVRLYERVDDVCSVAYWYQSEPHAKQPQLPEKEDRWPR